MLKAIDNSMQLTGTIGAPANGASVSLAKVKTFSAQCNVTVNTPSAKTFIDGTKQVQVIDFVADSAGSLNSKWFSLNSINTTTGALKAFYVWFDINSAGVDPAPAGKTGVHITGATGVSASTLASAVKTALDALTGDFATSVASTSHLTVTNANPGLVAAAADGTAATSFTFNTPSTLGVNSKVNPVLDTISITAHGLPSGLVGQLTSTGTLPAGLSTSTDYFVIVVDANTIKLASSLANAQAGTAVDITGYGTTPATSTFTPTALATGVVKLQKSNDGTNWNDEVAGTGDTVTANVAATGSSFLQKTDPAAAFMRVAYSLASGSFSSSTVLLTQGNE